MFISFGKSSLESINEISWIKRQSNIRAKFEYAMCIDFKIEKHEYIILIWKYLLTILREFRRYNRESVIK